MVTTKRVLIPLLLLIALICTANKCKEDELTVDIDVSEQNLCSQISDVTCSNMFECCTGAEIEAYLGKKLSTSEEACRKDVALSCEKNNSQLLYAFNNQTAGVNKEVLDACLNELLVQNDMCFPFVPMSTFAPSCSDVLILGKQSVGAPCLFDFECQGDDFCGIDRKCKALPTTGESCADGSVCAEGLFCNPDFDSRVCRPKVGAEQECDNSDQCQDDLYCELMDEVPVGMKAGICKAKKENGRNCEQNYECATGNCLPGTCDNGNSCYTNADCGGQCSESGYNCLMDEDCGGVCDDNNGYSCNDDFDCSDSCVESGEYCYEDLDCGGACEDSGDFCTNEYDCNYDENEACVPVDACEPTECVLETCEAISLCNGPPTCAENYATIDFCDPSAVPGLVNTQTNDDEIN